MAIRIRTNGDIVCAALNTAEQGDIYIDDAVHSMLCEKKLIVTQAEPTHSSTKGQWWWKGKEPIDVIIDPWWYEK